MVKEEPLSAWKAESFYSLSEKLECGKTRAIYSSDTLTYFAFEHLLKPVEGVWRNQRAILDPGGIGTWRIGRRIQAMRGANPVNVMLDYDDFNSRHMLLYMAIVIEELCDHVGYPAELREKLVRSIYHGTLRVGGEVLGRVMGTLMSGHRATTFFNTILNEAYIRVAYPRITELKSMHVGDDVYISAPSFAVAQDVLKKCESAGLAMNPIKQSVGVYAAEFLRVCYADDAARGYVCRSISSCVNGNWVSEVRLNAEEGLRSIVAHSWTLCNRARNVNMGALLVSSVKRICRLSSRDARNLLTGRVALNDGPCRYTGLHVDSMCVDVDTSAEEEAVALATQGFAEYATLDFLTHCAQPIEQYVLGELGASLVDTMRCASYRKTMISSGDVAGAVPAAKVSRSFDRRGVKTTVQLEKSAYGRGVGGVLSQFPLLQFVKKRITGDLLLMALLIAGVRPGVGEDIEELAWGRKAKAVSVLGSLSYADASALTRRCDEDLVYSPYNYYV
jgi:hypothetical protein